MANQCVWEARLGHLDVAKRGSANPEALRILLLEDDLDLSAGLESILRGAGFAVERVSDGLIGLAIARSDTFAAIILERSLQGADGLSVVRALREEGIAVPILFLSAMNDLADRVTGLESGADDYLAKPFAPSELLARVHAILRRHGAHSGGASSKHLLRSGPIEIDLIRRTVHCNGQLLSLQPKEFQLLEFFVRSAGRVSSRETLLKSVWNIEFDPGTNVVETHVSRLRKKLNLYDRSGIIQTVRGHGYVLRRDNAN